MSAVRAASGALGIAILASWAVTGGYSSASYAQTETALPALPVRSVDPPRREKIVAMSDPFAEQVTVANAGGNYNSNPGSANRMMPLTMQVPPRMGQQPGNNLSNLQVPGPDGSIGGPGGFMLRGGVHLYATTTTFAEVSVDSGPHMIVRVGDAVGSKRIRAIYGFDGAIELNDGTRISIEQSASESAVPIGAVTQAGMQGGPAVLGGPAGAMPPAAFVPRYQPGTPVSPSALRTGPTATTGASGQGDAGATGGKGVMIEPDPKPSDSLRPSVLPIHD